MTPLNSSEAPAMESRAPRFSAWGIGMVPGRVTTLAVLAISVAAFVSGMPFVGVLLVIAAAPTLSSFLSLGAIARTFHLSGSDLSFTTYTGRKGRIDLATLSTVQALGRGQKLVEVRLVAADGQALVIDSRHDGLVPLVQLILEREPAVDVLPPKGIGRLTHFWDGADPTLRSWGRPEIEASVDSGRAVIQGTGTTGSSGGFPWRLAVPNALGLLLIIVAIAQLALGGPRAPAVVVAVVGAALLLLGYLPLRYLSRSLVITDQEIQGRTLAGADVRIPRDGVSRLLVPASSASDIPQALLLGSEGQRLLVVRSGATAEGFDVLVSRYECTDASFWETITSFPISR